ncbi:MAG: phosphoribosylglycinamide formyltransferase [Desulfuromonadaceae bacterium]|nr:phosphoribosylglycinamide formyltransferase [Desulfuromonadaceae bacterium]
MEKKIRIGALVSGRGTNLQAIVEACRRGFIDAEVVQAITNRAEAGAVDRCRKEGIPCLFIDHRNFPNREGFDAEAVAALRKAGTDLVVLAGFMRLLTPVLVRAFAGRIMNIHPSLLPAFPGLHPQKQALDHGVRFSGCTVHFVDEGVDSGPIILQAVVPVADDDSVESLQRRILEQEHIIYPQAIRLFVQERLAIEGRRVRILPPKDS